MRRTGMREGPQGGRRFASSLAAPSSPWACAPPMPPTGRRNKSVKTCLTAQAVRPTPCSALVFDAVSVRLKPRHHRRQPSGGGTTVGANTVAKADPDGYNNPGAFQCAGDGKFYAIQAHVPRSTVGARTFPLAHHAASNVPLALQPQPEKNISRSGSRSGGQGEAGAMNAGADWNAAI